MADLYLNHGAYATNIGTTPTWGVPQEGDGSSKDAATAGAIGSVLFGSVPASGAFSVCGVTISTTGVIGAASVDAAANTLATNINATTTAVAAGVAVGVPQLRNLVYARGPSGGAPSGTCQIMMRVGSTTLNNATNANAAVATTFSGSPTLTQFAGGSGGCWGWLVNSAAIGVSSSIAVGVYGIGVSKPMVWTATPTQDDYVFCRTGSGKTITMPNTTSFSRGNVGFPLNLVFDTNTKWTTDSGTGVFRLNLVAPGGSFIYFRPETSNANGNQVMYRCLLKGNFEVGLDASAGSSQIGLFNNCTMFSAYGVRFVETAVPSGTSAITLCTYGQAATLRFVSCNFDFSTYTRSNLASGPYLDMGSSSGGTYEAEDCDFKFNLTGVPADTQPFFRGVNSTTWATYGMFIRLSNNRFDTNSGYKVKAFTSTVNPANGFVGVVMENNSGLALDAAYLGIQNAADYRRSSRQNSFVFIGDDSGRHQRFECWNGVAEWNPNAATPHPTLAAQQPDGTAYSVRMYWLDTTAMLTFNPFGYRSSLFNRLTTGVRTIVQHLFYDTTRGIDGRQLGIVVSYVDSTGVPRSETTHFNQDPVASGSTWANAGSYSGFSAMKLTVVTSYSVKQNTEIKVDVVLIGNPPGSGNTDVYVDPEFSIT